MIMQDGKHVHTSVEEYDAGSDRWSVLAGHLPFERKYHTACELSGKHLSYLSSHAPTVISGMPLKPVFAETCCTRMQNDASSAR